MTLTLPESAAFECPRAVATARNPGGRSGYQRRDRTVGFGSFLDSCSEEQSAAAAISSGRERRALRDERDLSQNPTSAPASATMSEMAIPGLDLLPSKAQAVLIGTRPEHLPDGLNPIRPVLDESPGPAALVDQQNRTMDAASPTERLNGVAEPAFGARLYPMERSDPASPSNVPAPPTPAVRQTPLPNGSLLTHARQIDNASQASGTSDSDSGHQSAPAIISDSGLAQREINEPGSLAGKISALSATEPQSRKPDDSNKTLNPQTVLGSPVTLATPREPETRADAVVTEVTASSMDDLRPKSTPPPHSVSVRVDDGDRSVDIRMAERGGEIRVMVQTPDRHLAESLREDLPDLVTRLRHCGFQAETWKPQPASRPDSSQQNDSGKFSSFSQQNQESGGKKRQQRNSGVRWVSEWNASASEGAEVSL